MIFQTLHERFIRSVSFPFSQYCFNRRNIGYECRQSLCREYSSPDSIAAFQEQKLRVVVEHACKFVPFYQRRFKEAGITPDSITTIDDLRRIPPLSRDDLVNFKTDLVDYRYRPSIEAADASRRGPGEPMPFARFRKFPLAKNASSGSTGAPTVFYDDGTISAISWANEIRVKRWFGLQQGAREARLVRVSPEFVEKNRKNRLRRFLWNQMVLPGMNLTERDYGFIIGQLNGYRPKTIWSMTSAIAELARFLNETPACPLTSKPMLIITWAAPLYDHEKKIIRKIFSCPVTNIYGMREVGHIGALCGEGKLHVFQETHFLETDDNNELLVTFLRPTAMPLIRYRTGDRGELAIEKCGCGRTLQVIREFHGRTGEIFFTGDGRMIAPNFWCRTFMDDRLAATIRRFQIIYTKDKSIRIKLMAPDAHRPTIDGILRQTVTKNFGASTQVRFEYVDSIAPQLSGKYQMVINETE